MAISSEMLEDVATKALKERYHAMPETTENLDMALGSAVAQYADWKAKRILTIFENALEDANYHVEAEIVRGWLNAKAGH